MFKRTLVVFLSFFAALLVLFLLGWRKNYKKAPVTAAEERLIQTGAMRRPRVVEKFPRLSEKKKQELEKLRVVLHTNFGDITLKFFPREAPQAVQNFKKLTEDGFCDNTRFYAHYERVGIVGGLPIDSDEVDAGYYIKDEVNEHKHIPGAVGMFRSPKFPDRGSCQFYICPTEIPESDGEFTIFAQVTEGLEVVQKIAALEVDARGQFQELILVESVSLQEASD